MNEETTLPSETWDSLPSESTALALEETDSAVVPEIVSPEFIPVETEKSLADWFTDPTEVTEAIEGLPFYVPEETVAETVAPETVQVIEEWGSGIVHSTLFSGFLICGTLIGCTLFRKIYGT